MTRLVANIPRESALAIMERRAFPPGVNVLAEPQRRTRYGLASAPGLRERGRRERPAAGPRPLAVRPVRGRGGVEKMYDDLLRGTDGGLQFITDAAGGIQVLGGCRRPRAPICI